MRTPTTHAAVLPNDLGTPDMHIIADEVVSEWQRAWVLRQLAKRLKVVDADMSPQLLSRYGHSPASIRAQADLLRRARAGSRRAKAELLARYACRVVRP